MVLAPWVYPADRYYYCWYEEPTDWEPTDGDIKSTVANRLRDNPLTADSDIWVDVRQHVVVLGRGGFLPHSPSDLLATTLGTPVVLSTSATSCDQSTTDATALGEVAWREPRTPGAGCRRSSVPAERRTGPMPV